MNADPCKLSNRYFEKKNAREMGDE